MPYQKLTIGKNRVDSFKDPFHLKGKKTKQKNQKQLCQDSGNIYIKQKMLSQEKGKLKTRQAL